jgi:hypothetical protein
MMSATPRAHFSAVTAVAAAATLLALAGCDENPTALRPGAPAALLIVSGDEQQGTVNAELANPVVVRVTDENDQPVPGQIVNFRVTAGNGSVFAGAAITNAGGIAQERWTLGTVATEIQRLEVRAVDPATGAPLVFATFRATAVAGPAATIEMVEGDNAVTTAGTAVSVAPRVRVVDEFSNPVSGFAVMFAVASGGGAATGTTATTDASGLATVGSWRLGAVGANTLTAAGAGLTGSPVTFSATATSGNYTISASVFDAPVGTQFVVTAQLTDGAGTPVPVAGRTVTWSNTGGAGSFESATSTTNAQGTASVTFTVGTVFSGDVTVIGTDNLSATGSRSVSVSRGPPAKLYFVTQPSTVGWRITMANIRVGVTDVYDNVIPAGTHSVTLALETSPGGATLTGGAATSMVNGVATFSDVTLDRPGTGYRIRANSGTLEPAVSAAFEVNAIAVVTTHSSDMRGLSVGGFVSFSLSSGFVYAAPLTGGAAVQRGFFGSFGDGGQSGRLLDDGTYVNFLRELGSLSRSGSIHRIRPGSPTVTFNLGPWSPGPDFEFDGTYFYTQFNPAPNSPENVRGVHRVSASDGTVTRIVERPGNTAPPVIAVAGGYLYFSDTLGATTVIKRVPVAGGTATVVTDIGTITRTSWRTMLVVGSELYWSESGNGGATAGSIRSAPASGGAATTRVSNLSPAVRNMVSDGTYLFVNDGGSLRRYDLATFSATTIDGSGTVADVALDGEGVYWISNGSIRAIKKTPK